MRLHTHTHELWIECYTRIVSVLDSVCMENRMHSIHAIYLHTRTHEL